MHIYKKLYEAYGSQEAIARAVGVSQKTVHTWSRGSYPSIANAQKIGEMLDISLGEVFDEWVSNPRKKEA